MKTKLKCVMLLAICLTCITGCTSEESSIVPKERETTKKTGAFTFSITPSLLTTKALDTKATEDEKKVKKVDLLIFDSAGDLEIEESHTTFDVVNNEYRFTIEGLSVENGKRLFIGVNVPNDLFSKIKNDLKNNIVNDTNLPYYTVNLDDLTNKTDGFVMFNRHLEDINIHADNQENQKGNINVCRAVAKISVMKEITLPYAIRNNGGKIHSMKFAVQKNNANFYIWDKNGSPELDDNCYNGEYKDIGNVPDGIDPNAVYAMENLFKEPEKATFVRVLCTFTPSGFMTKNGQNWENMVYNGDPIDFYKLTITTQGASKGFVYYFKSKKEANNYLLNYGLEGDIAEYGNGKCYYDIFTDTRQDDHKIKRNCYYTIRITDIAGLGKPAETPDPSGDYANMQFRFAVEDWVPVDKGGVVLEED